MNQLSKEEIRTIRRLHARGVKRKDIVKQTGHTMHTIARYMGKGTGNHKLTPELVDKLAEDERSGMKRIDICAKYGISGATVISALGSKQDYLRIPTKNKKQIILLFSRGIKPKQIAEKMGLTYQQVWKIIDYSI